MTGSLATSCPHEIGRPVMRQQWRHLLFVHGRCSTDVLRSLLPEGVEVDEFDGSGWVSYVPFTMRGITFGPLPPLPYLSTFPEVNIRTYVRHEGVPYVWFFSLDIPRLIPVGVARSVFALPYMYSSVQHERTDQLLVTSTHRRGGRCTARSLASISSTPSADELDVFLTARWGLLAATRRSVLDVRIHHEPWQLYPAELLDFEEGLSAAAGLPEWSPERVTYSPGLPVTVGRPHRVGPRRTS